MAFLILRRKALLHQKFLRAHIAELPGRDFRAVSIGLFIFIFYPARAPGYRDWAQKISVHEYGHTCQVLLLGPLYWIVVGLPSLVWCKSSVLQRYRARHNISYYSFYCESWADKLARIFTGL